MGLSRKAEARPKLSRTAAGKLREDPGLDRNNGPLFASLLATVVNQSFAEQGERCVIFWLKLAG